MTIVTRSISESRLETWAKQGAITSAKRAHKSVRKALAEHDWPDGMVHDVYLQGSYKNDTNTYGDSDVDLIAELTSTFRPNDAGLEAGQKELLALYPKASYTWEDFLSEVEKALVNYYGSGKLARKNKCIKVETSHLPADLVVAQSYRLYGYGEEEDKYGLSYMPGIQFWTRDGRNRIVNFPRPHHKDGVDKHQATSGRYKPLVRCFKNARSHLVGEGEIPEDLAPSYFVECLLYNVPDRHFEHSYQATAENVLGALASATLSDLRCQNGITKLFGPNSTQWSTAKAGRMIAAWTELLTE